jgi:hypothetical protein
MTNLQLLLTICIPSLLIVLSSLQQSARMTRLESAFDKSSDSVDHKFDAMRSELVALRDSIHRDMVSLLERIAIVESKQN